MMTGELLVAVVTSVIVGVASGAIGAYVTIKVLTNEIKWINKILEKHDKEIDRLHDRFSSHITRHHANNHTEA